MRFLTPEMILVESYKGPIESAPPSLKPWFQFDCKIFESHRVFFGHWASLGMVETPNYVCVDTGCVWGASLTAYAVEEKRAYQVKSVEGV